MHFDHALETQAKLVCMACPVRVDCLAYAVAAAEPDGVWGGKNADERGIIRRNRDLYEARYRNARNGTTATDATPDR
jgi:WhiB family redox-sensing transcriptional regulator